MTPEPPEYLTKTALKARGWTDALIAKFLTHPDATKANPKFRSAARMQLYARDRVERIEATEPFQAALSVSAKRKTAASAGARTKAQRTLSAIAAVSIRPPTVIDRKALVRRACAHYNAHQTDRNPLDPRQASPADDATFLDRIMVNYLRHELTHYDVHCAALVGQIGKDEAWRLLRAKVFGAICESYPHLADECARQQTGGR